MKGLAQLTATLGREFSYALLQAVAPWDEDTIHRGLHQLVEAQAAAQGSGERFMEAELYRLKGTLLLARSAEQHAEAETCFQQALTVARHQQAKSWELRAAMSLSRLWQQQGKWQEAYDLLAPIYGWFTEGFDTPDLQDARALLEELAG